MWEEVQAIDTDQGSLRVVYYSLVLYFFLNSYTCVSFVCDRFQGKNSKEFGIISGRPDPHILLPRDMEQMKKKRGGGAEITLTDVI